MSNQNPSGGSTQGHRPGDPMFHRRVDAITQSQMHADAVKILRLARTLESAVNDFANEYLPDSAFEIFREARCCIPSDISEDVPDANREWSKWVYEDVKGFQWGLKMFLSALSSNLCVPREGSEEDETGTESQAIDDEEVSPAFVCGEGGGS